MRNCPVLIFYRYLLGWDRKISKEISVGHSINWCINNQAVFNFGHHQSESPFCSILTFLAHFIIQAAIEEAVGWRLHCSFWQIFQPRFFTLFGCFGPINFPTPWQNRFYCKMCIMLHWSVLVQCLLNFKLTQFFILREFEMTQISLRFLKLQLSLLLHNIINLLPAEKQTNSETERWLQPKCQEKDGRERGMISS